MTNEDGAPTLEKMCQHSQEAYPGSEPALATIAGSHAGELEEVLKHIEKETLGLRRSLYSAEKSYDAELTDAGANSTEALRLAAVELAEAEGRLGEVEERNKLAASIRSLQDRLALPMRTVATALSVLALGIGSTVYAMESQPERYGDLTTKDAKTTEDIYTRSPLAVGIVAGVIGGFAAWGASDTLTGREARRRARRAIARQQKIKKA